MSYNVKGEAMKKTLSAIEMATIAKRLLDKQKGFTINEYGETPRGAPYAVSKVGHEEIYLGDVTIGDIAHYLSRHPIAISDAFLGGWIDEKGVTYLDHTLLFAHKHTAVHEAIHNDQRAIFNLETKETINLEGVYA